MVLYLPFQLVAKRTLTKVDYGSSAAWDPPFPCKRWRAPPWGWAARPGAGRRPPPSWTGPPGWPASPPGPPEGANQNHRFSATIYTEPISSSQTERCNTPLRTNQFNNVSAKGTDWEDNLNTRVQTEPLNQHSGLKADQQKNQMWLTEANVLGSHTSLGFSELVLCIATY